MPLLTARDVLYGSPPAEGHEPAKADFRAYLEQIESQLGAGGIVGFAAEIVDLPASDNTEGDYRLVLSADADDMGVYQWGGSSWSQVAPLPAIYWNDVYAVAAQGSADSAADDAALAQRWAAEDEDVVVEGGLYSALHYAAKAAADAGAASTSETNAGTSETNAGASAATATTKAGEASASAADASDDADAIADLLGAFTELDDLIETAGVGRTTLVASTSSYQSAATTFVYADPFEFDGVISMVHARSYGTVTLSIAGFSKAGNDFTRETAWVDVAIVAGENNVATALAVTAGHHLGFYWPTATRIERTLSVTNPLGGGYYNAAGKLDSFTDATLTNTVQTELGVTYERQYVTTERVAEISNSVDDLETAFEIAAAVNSYDVTLAQDQKSLSLASGILIDLSYRMFSGFQAVEPDKTYTVKMGHWLGFALAQRFICQNSAGVYLGIDQSNGVNPVAPNPPTGITWASNHEVTFTIPSGSAIRFMGINLGDWHGHTTEDYTAVINSIQWQEGASATAFERPLSGGGYLRLRPEHLPTADFAELLAPTAEQLVVHRNGDLHYVRTIWDDTYDLVDVFGVGARAATSYMPNFGGGRLITKEKFNLPQAWGVNSSKTFVIEPDDVGPLNFGGTYVGANHGCDDAISVTATAHGKTNEDVGSTWVDGAGHNFVLMSVIGANTLQFLSENRSAYPAWSFWDTISGTALTHVSDATHTGTITLSASSSLQLTPGAGSVEIEFLADGVVVPDGTAVRAERLVCRVRYNVNNPASMVDYAVANVGAATAPDYTDSSIEADAIDEITYTWSASGACAIARASTLLNAQASFGHIYMTQAVAQQLTGTEALFAYVPRMTALSGGQTLSDEENISSLVTNLLLTSAYYADGANPPLSTCEIVADAGTRSRSFAIGLVPGIGTGDPATRSTYSDRVGVIAGTTRKQYVTLAQTDTAETAGTSFDALAYRGWTNLAGDAAAREQFWFWAGSRLYLVLDYHAAVSARKIPLPKAVAGLPLVVLENAGVIIHSGDNAGPYGVMVSTSGAARAIIQIG